MIVYYGISLLDIFFMMFLGYEALSHIYPIIAVILFLLFGLSFLLLILIRPIVLLAGYAGLVGSFFVGKILTKLFLTGFFILFNDDSLILSLLALLFAGVIFFLPLYGAYLICEYLNYNFECDDFDFTCIVVCFLVLFLSLGFETRYDFDISYYEFEYYIPLAITLFLAAIICRADFFTAVLIDLIPIVVGLIINLFTEGCFICVYEDEIPGIILAYIAVFLPPLIVGIIIPRIKKLF